MSAIAVEQLSAVAAAMSAVLTLIGVIFVVTQLQLARQIAAADFLLRIEDELREHRDVHLKLRPGGVWADGDGPKSADEWAAVEAYMGLFERVGSTLINPGIIDRDLTKRSYGYRIWNIVANPVIRSEKLDKERDSWTDFIRLQKILLGK